MMAPLQGIVLKIDALTLRERIVVFALVALVLVMLVNVTVINPQFSKQKQLSQRLKQEQSQIAAIQADIGQKLQGQQADPDAPNRARLQAVTLQLGLAQNALQDMQKGLVSPEKITALLEDLLKQNGKLRLVSLKTMPAISLSAAIAAGSKTEEGSAAQASAAAPKPQGKPAAESIYQHGVEIVVEGSYLDMMNYMAALEAMPWQLFWGKVTLNVDVYPKATLTLTLFTLSLDKKWLNL